MRHENETEIIAHEQLEKSAVELYQKGIKLAEICDYLGKGRTWVYTTIKKYNVNLRPRHAYKFKDSVFEEKTNHKYYLLGLFAADGCISKNRSSKYVEIGLQKNDVALLNDIVRVFQTDKPLHFYKNMSKLTLYSDRLYDTLVEWGITPRKSLNIQLQKEIPLEFVRDFLRGVFDGDGCLTKSRYTPALDCCVSASKVFAEQIKAMYENLGYLPALYSQNRGTNHSLYVVRLRGISALRCLADLYSSKGLYLPRKYEKFLEFTRLTLDETMMEAAYLFSRRSTCVRLKVGCVLTDNDKNNVISVGYNGGIAGLANHCESTFPGLCGCIHAEPGALIKGRGPVLYCTHLPCTQCAKLIINAGVKQICYSEKYRNDYSLELFSRKDLQVKHLPREKYAWKLDITPHPVGVFDTNGVAKEGK